MCEHSLTAEKIYSINFAKHYTKFYLNLHYNGANSYLFVSGTEIHKFKANDSEIEPNILCLGNVSKDVLANNAIGVDDILNIHKYLVERNNII